MSKKYLLPAKRAFEINFLTQLCRVKKYFYPRKCAVCRLADKPCARRGCSAEKSQRDFFDGLRPPDKSGGLFYLIPRLSAMSWSLSTDSLSRVNSS